MEGKRQPNRHGAARIWWCLKEVAWNAPLKYPKHKKIYYLSLVGTQDQLIACKNLQMSQSTTLISSAYKNAGTRRIIF